MTAEKAAPPASVMDRLRNSICERFGNEMVEERDWVVVPWDMPGDMLSFVLFVIFRVDQHGRPWLLIEDLSCGTSAARPLDEDQFAEIKEKLPDALRARVRELLDNMK